MLVCMLHEFSNINAVKIKDSLKSQQPAYTSMFAEEHIVTFHF